MIVLVIVVAVLLVPGLRASLAAAYIDVSTKVFQSQTEKVSRDLQTSADDARRRASRPPATAGQP